MTPPSTHLRFGSQLPEDDFVLLQGHSPHIDIDPASSSNSDDDALPETISLQSGKEADQTRVLKNRELARKRKDASKARDSEILARKLEFERKELRQQKKSERNLAKNLRKRSKLQSSASAKEGKDLPGPEEVRTKPGRYSQDDNERPYAGDEATVSMGRAIARTEDETEQELDQDGDQEAVLHAQEEALSISLHALKNEEKRPHLRQSEKSPHHLPDTIFSAASKTTRIHASGHEPLTTGIHANERAQNFRSHKAQRPGRIAKDVIIGSRTVRPVALAVQIGSESSLRAPRSTKAFIARQLNTKRKAANKQWQRKSAHLALQSRTGPTRAFTKARR